MIRTSILKDHVPFGRSTFEVHAASRSKDFHSKSLSEAVGDISICDYQQSETWKQRVSTLTDAVEELYFKDKTVILSSTNGMQNGASKIIKSFTVQSKVQMVFWCKFVIPYSEIDSETGLYKDEIQNGFCIVESNMVTIVCDNGNDYYVSIPFHIASAWPLQHGIMFQRSTGDQLSRQHSTSVDHASKDSVRKDMSLRAKSLPGSGVKVSRDLYRAKYEEKRDFIKSHICIFAFSMQVSRDFIPNVGCKALPIWFSMLHPLADLSPVICKSGNDLAYISDSSHHLVFVSSLVPPYVAVVYDSISRLHCIYLTRHTTPNEEKTYIEISNDRSVDKSSKQNLTKHQSYMTSFTGHMTPSRSGTSNFLTLSSVLSPSAQKISPHIGANGGKGSLLSNNHTASPAVNRLSSSLSINSPSLASAKHLNPLKHSGAGSPSVVRSSFTSQHNPNQARDVDMNPELLEPIRPDICLQHIWTDSYSCDGKASRVFITTDLCDQHHLCLLIPAAAELRCIKLGISDTAEEQVIFGSAVNIPAKDACHIESLKMLLVLGLDSKIYIYTGPTQICQLLIPPGSFGSSSMLSATPIRPAKNMVLASSRPGSAHGDQKLAWTLSITFDTPHGTSNNWSPVEVDLNNSSNFFLQETATSCRVISSLHSVIKYKVVVSLSNGEMCSTELPSFTTNPMVRLCVRALSLYLPYTDIIQSLPRWYLLNHLPGQADSEDDELDKFFGFIVSICGLSGMENPREKGANGRPASPCVSNKRARTMFSPSDDDFSYLLSTKQCQRYQEQSLEFGLTIPESVEMDTPVPAVKLFLEEDFDKTDAEPSRQTNTLRKTSFKVEKDAPLSCQIYNVFLILHLCYQEMTLNTAYTNYLHRLSKFLFKLAWSLQLTDYLHLYLRDYPYMADELSSLCDNLVLVEGIALPLRFPRSPIPFVHMLSNLLSSGKDSSEFYFLPYITERIHSIITLYSIYGQQVKDMSDLDTSFITPLPVVGKKSPRDLYEASRAWNSCDSTEELMVLYLARRGYDANTLDTLPYAVSTLLHEVILKCQAEARPHWQLSVLTLIQRQDLACLKQGRRFKVSTTPFKELEQNQEENTPLIVHQSNGKQKHRTGMEYLNKQVLSMRWKHDLRVEEVKRCLDSSQPAKITLQQKPEVSDHQFIEEKQRHLLAICQRTMALPVGRGMFMLRSHRPVLTESLHIPILCLSGKSYPTQSSVELSNDSQATSPTRLSVWPAFHNGVAAGLCIDKDAEIDTTWILFNKPDVTEKDEQNLISEHAGFLMALGLNGHLTSLARLSLHDYLVKGHEMTAIGILLGISATMRGTMDIDTVKLLTIHIPSLLPPSTTQLDLSHSTRIAALVGLGLVYHGSAHRHIANVLLKEIDHPPNVSKGQATDRESYAAAAGLALGMVMMGKGSKMVGLTDLNIANQLCLLMTGGHRTAANMDARGQNTARVSNGQVYEGDLINIDVTGAGATLALGLTYFNTNNHTVCEWLAIPQSQYLLEAIRPDFLQLKVISRCLIMWNSIVPSDDWIASFLPSIVHVNAFKRPSPTYAQNLDYETFSQAYCYIVSGTCFSIALKFAGTCNKDAYHLLLTYTKKFIDYSQSPSAADQAGKPILENAVCVCLVSLAMVMSGSGDLQVIRLCRYLRTRIGQPTITYGSQMAVHLALGLLFLGSGRFSLSSRPEAIPILLCAFFPKFPMHSNDNRYHLQALRHLYVLAAEPRLLLPVDIDTRSPCSLNAQVTLQPYSYNENVSYMTKVPAILPDVDSLKILKLTDDVYWPVSFNCSNDFKEIREILANGQGIPVKKRPGQLLNEETSQEQNCHLLLVSQEQFDTQSFNFMCLRRATCKEKPQVIAIYSHLSQMLYADRPDRLSGLQLQSLYLLSCYCKSSRNCAVSKDVISYVLRKVRDTVSQNLDHTEVLSYCINGSTPKSSTTWRCLSLNAGVKTQCFNKDTAQSVVLAKIGIYK